MTPALSPLAAKLRHHDRDRYQMSLFAPAPRREALVALYAFNYEIARIREAVREPMLGLMRLQWWRDALDEIYASARPRRHEVLEPLAAAIRTHGLSQAYFGALLDARTRDMEEEPPASLDALETYAEGSTANLIRLALEILDADADAAAAGGVGVAYGLTGLLVAVPFHARDRRHYLPQDLIARERLDIERSLLALKPSPALAAVARDVARLARRRLDEARREEAKISRAALPALLHGVVAERRLKRLARAGHDVMDPHLAAVDTLQALRLSWAALRGRF